MKHLEKDPGYWLVGYSYYPNVPAGRIVEVSNPGIAWPADQLPGPGQYCFVATVGNGYAPPPYALNFPTLNDFTNYIYANNNITCRNFTVVAPSVQPPTGLTATVE